MLVIGYKRKGEGGGGHICADSPHATQFSPILHPFAVPHLYRLRVQFAT